MVGILGGGCFDEDCVGAAGTFWEEMVGPAGGPAGVTTELEAAAAGETLVFFDCACDGDDEPPKRKAPTNDLPVLDGDGEEAWLSEPGFLLGNVGMTASSRAPT